MIDEQLREGFSRFRPLIRGNPKKRSFKLLG
jgi:hypothetical protein